MFSGRIRHKRYVAKFDFSYGHCQESQDQISANWVLVSRFIMRWTNDEMSPASFLTPGVRNGEEQELVTGLPFVFSP